MAPVVRIAGGGDSGVDCVLGMRASERVARAAGAAVGRLRDAAAVAACDGRRAAAAEPDDGLTRAGSGRGAALGVATGGGAWRANPAVAAALDGAAGRTLELESDAACRASGCAPRMASKARSSGPRLDAGSAGATAAGAGWLSGRAQDVSGRATRRMRGRSAEAGAPAGAGVA